MTKTVAILATLDTKGRETGYLKEQIEALGGRAFVIDIGVVGTPGLAADVTRQMVADAGGTSLAELRSRTGAAPFAVAALDLILPSTTMNHRRRRAALFLLLNGANWKSCSIHIVLQQQLDDIRFAFLNRKMERGDSWTGQRVGQEVGAAVERLVRLGIEHVQNDSDE